jgi:hypothetical protein
MSVFRALALASILSALLVACGGAGSGGTSGGAPSSSPSPALGTNKPATSGDPYSDYGY